MNTGLSDFIAKARADEGLRKQITEVEELACRELERNTDAIRAIAVREGFDVKDWTARPRAEFSAEEESEFDAACPSTCCYIATSVCCVVEE